MPKKPTKIQIPDCCPFRRSSNYAVGFGILWRHRKTGISFRQLLKEYMAATSKPQRLAMYDLRVLTSPKQCGTGHPSAHRHNYWVDRQGENLRLHLDTTP